jgi:multidrug efflux pump
MAGLDISHRFIDRPILAGVLSLFIFIAGGISMFTLPISEYPEVVPPQIVVAAAYPGANPKVISETVAAPLEEQINGVENMLYMSSQANTDGAIQITVTFALGTDPDLAQQRVQNRVAQATPRLPDVVRALGVTTLKSSPDLTMVVHLYSPNDRYDMAYLRNYALLNVKDQLGRLQGIGQVELFGSGDYAMRVWLNPEKLAARQLSAPDVVNAIREQNIQIAAGTIGAQPTSSDIAFEMPVNVQGRLKSIEEFEGIIIKADAKGAVTKLADVARIELGASSYSLRSLLNNKPAVAIPVFQQPGSNALQISADVRETMARLSKNFPEGVQYDIVYDPTRFVQQSIDAVITTLLEAILLVVIVVIVFLQTWRASIIPLIAVPISIVGTFAVMHLFGFSINALSLFGLVLAIGIVVDDAIVVVENVERNISNGLSPREATYVAMREVSGPIIAIALVLCAVFVPIAFISGLTGQFYKQFALTIAISTVISAFNSLTLSPALAAILLKHGEAEKDKLTKVIDRVAGGFTSITRRLLWALAIFVIGKLVGMAMMKLALGVFGHNPFGPPPVIVMIWSTVVPAIALLVAASLSPWLVLAAICHLIIGFAPFMGEAMATMPWLKQVLQVLVYVFYAALILAAIQALRRLINPPREWGGFSAFNHFFHQLSERYAHLVAWSFHQKKFLGMVYLALIAVTIFGFTLVPQGYVPGQDKQYLVGFAQLPPGASLDRSDAVIRQMSEIALKHPGVENSIAFPGLSIAGFSNSSSAGIVFVGLKPFSERKNPALSAGAITGALNEQFGAIQGAFMAIFPPPPVQGMGTIGGFKLEIQDRADMGYDALDGVIKQVMGKAYQNPALAQVFSSFQNGVPQLQVDINRTRAKQQGVPLNDLFDTLQMYLGSYYVNDFNLFGRTFRVYAAADAPYRSQMEDIAQLKVRNARGDMVPLGSLVNVSQTYGPERATRYNAFRSADINGDAGPGFSSGQAKDAIIKILDETLPKGMTYEWTELTYQQILAGNTALFVFPLCVLFVFLVLAAQYESLSLPMAVILIVPLCLVGAIFGVWLAGKENNIFTQIGFIVLVGLACKNSILIVEFARELEHQGRSISEAALEAARLRLRPILMTSIAFIMGVVPLVIATGAGSEMRQDMGVAVFSGMIGVTVFGLLMTPMFYVIVRSLTVRYFPPKPLVDGGTHA